jgi:2'-5' RNA ligase
MRLFVGVSLPATVIDELSAISLRLRSNGDGLRWLAPGSWHITLQFLGKSSQEQYDCTFARLHEVRMAPVPIALEGLGLFDREGILFASVKITAELFQLQERVTGATQLCGFIPEARPFQPHITLARSKGKGQFQGLIRLKAKIAGELNFTRFVADEFLLYESFLSPSGARHEVRGRFPLAGRQMIPHAMT